MPNLELYTTILQILSILTLITGWATSVTGVSLHRRCTGKISFLWYITYMLPLMLPIASYLTGKLSKQICTKKKIQSDHDYGHLGAIFSSSAILVFVSTCGWFSLLENPDINSLKLLCMGLITTLMLHQFGCLITPVQFFHRKRAIDSWIVRQRSSKKA